MQESKTSIRIFLFLYGIGMISSGISIINYPHSDVFALKLLGAFSLLFGIGYIYNSITLSKKLNPVGVKSVLSFLRLGFILNLVNILFWLLANVNFGKLIFSSIISTLLFLYLYRNIKRLSEAGN